MKKRKSKFEVIILRKPNEEDCKDCNLGKGMEVIAREMLGDIYEAYIDGIEDISAFDDTIVKIRKLIAEGEDERALDLIYLLALLSDFSSRAKIEAFVSGSDERIGCFLDKFEKVAEELYGEDSEGE